MPITECPGCGQSLEVPSIVPGGLVACPYCNAEFAVTSKGAARGAKRATSGARGPSRRRDHDDYDEYDDRPRRRRPADRTGLYIAVAAIVILALGGVFILIRMNERKAQREAELQKEIAAKPIASFPYRAPQLPATVHSFTLENDLAAGNKISMNNLVYSAAIDYADSEGNETTPYGLSYSVTGDTTNEKVTAVNGDVYTIEGRYQIASYMDNGVIRVTDPIVADLRIHTDRWGNPSGTIERIGGGTLATWPHLLPERGYGILQRPAVGEADIWGAPHLLDTISAQLNTVLKEFRIESIPFSDGGRKGGWYNVTKELRFESDGKTWVRDADLALKLYAVENRRETNGRFLGQPADISVGSVWRGQATYMLFKKSFSQVQGLSHTIKIMIKTPRAWYQWEAREHVDMLAIEET